MAVDENLVGCERDHRPAAHRVMRNDGGDLSVVIRQCGRDLARGEHEPARRVQDDLDRAAGRCLADRAQHALGVVDVDVPHQRDAEE